MKLISIETIGTKTTIKIERRKFLFFVKADTFVQVVSPDYSFSAWVNEIDNKMADYDTRTALNRFKTEHIAGTRQDRKKWYNHTGTLTKSGWVDE